MIGYAHYEALLLYPKRAEAMARNEIILERGFPRVSCADDSYEHVSRSGIASRNDLVGADKS
jgi:hypothetical protein